MAVISLVSVILEHGGGLVKAIATCKLPDAGAGLPNLPKAIGLALAGIPKPPQIGGGAVQKVAGEILDKVSKFLSKQLAICGEAFVGKVAPIEPRGGGGGGVGGGGGGGVFFFGAPSKADLAGCFPRGR